MTEDEAKAKWCPFARVVCYDDQAPPGYIPPANRAAIKEAGELSINENPEHARCIASACMAWRTRSQWRWADIEPPAWHSGGVDTTQPVEVRLDGYCGLAGSVQ
ncbi:hypothetical protein [Phenylobacterium sp.]|uniref:hypothetical protein n=1 Tax=Phenylobacterium sp. TaxID=1871053 RepID=UPI002FC7DAB6